MINMQWKFKSDGKSPARMGIYRTTLDSAFLAMDKAMPFHSKFKVGCVIARVSASGETAFYQGSNFEYGAGYKKAKASAVHAEISTVDKVRGELRDGDEIVIATIGDAPNVVTPCGHCLDILRTFFPLNTEILVANASGSVEILKLLDLFPTALASVDFADLSIDTELMLTARTAFDRSIVLDESLREGAAIRTRTAIFHGARIDTVAYHPTSAVTSAIASAVSTGDLDIETIAFISRDGELGGLDRQRIYELFDALKRLQTRRIFIQALDSDSVFVASAKELLPYGFGITTLGLDFKVATGVEASSHG